MAPTDLKSGSNLGSTDALVALVRLLARQAAREMVQARGASGDAPHDAAMAGVAPEPLDSTPPTDELKEPACRRDAGR